MLEVQQLEGKPKIFKESYPSTAYFNFKAVQIHYYFAMAVSEPTAVLIHLHGLNSHGGNSGYFGVNLAKQSKINTYAIDFQNFGKSGGEERGFIDSFEDSIAEAEAMVDHVLSEYSAKKPKVFLSGSSFGGSIAFKMAINNPSKYSGLILFAPALRELKEHQVVLKKVGLAIGFLFPKLKILSPTFNTGTKYKME